MLTTNSILATLVQTGLPIVEKLETIRELFRQSCNGVLQADPGAGKTTLVPLALLDIIPSDQKILLLEPRRLAARNAALRMADLLGEKVGKSIGYRIKNDVKVSTHTRIEVITEGILTRMLQSDPELPGIAMIIFDEFHERSLDADLGLAFAIEVQQNLRPELKLLVMSATLESERVAKLLGNAAIIQSSGRSFPVEIYYQPPKANFDWLQPLIEILLKQTSQATVAKAGEDILVFLPGVYEIKRAEKHLQTALADCPSVVLIPLYGDLVFDKQKRALEPIAGIQKIILATNLAETSVTINGVNCVIDSGLMRQSQFDPNLGFDRLITRKISSASAVQRSGRAGRLAPGICYRLWSESDNLRKENLPAILSADLSAFVLELAQWGISSPTQLPLMDQPNAGAFSQAQSLLVSLSALDKKHKLADHGRSILKLGIHPRLAHMLIKAKELGALELGCLLAAMLEEKDIFLGEQRFNPDFMARVDYLLNTLNKDYKIKSIRQQAKKLAKKLDDGECINDNTNGVSSKLTPVLLALAFPDRLAQKRGDGYRLATGSGAQVRADFSLDSEYLVAVQLGGRAQTPQIFQAMTFNKNDFNLYFSEQIKTSHQINWDPERQQVKSLELTRFNELVLESKITKADPQLEAEVLLAEISKLSLSILPWSDADIQLRARVSMLRSLIDYKEQFPDLSDKALCHNLVNWLGPFIIGKNKLSQITPQLLNQALASLFDWSSRQKLDSLMPVSKTVASGSQVRLDYSQGDKPVLAVKLQEMFGEPHTPQVANGKIPLLIHLLSPAQRPLQITSDLASFWQNSYPEVKKEMKGRYPKHPWPDDPLTAIATKLTKKRLAQK